MHVALVSPYDPGPTTCQDDRVRVGGVERVFRHLAQGLARRGHEVTLVCSTQGPSRVSHEDGVRVIREHRRGTLLGTPIVSLAKRIPADADIVHVPATYPFTTPSVLRRARRLGIPSVLDFHFEPHPASGLGRLAASAYRSVGSPSYGLAGAALVRSLSYGRSSPTLADVPETRWRVVPNGIDPDTFRPDGPARAGDYLLFVGRLVPYKGVEVLLRALAMTRDALPLVVAGDGPLRAALVAQARRLGVASTFLGRVPDADLPALYRGARLTVLPSVNAQESFGISLIESMACGTPVVASDLPGVDQVARQGGVLATPGDAESLHQQIRRATGPEMPSRGPELAARIHREYSWDAITSRVLDVYAGLVERSPPSDQEVVRIAHPSGRPVL